MDLDALEQNLARVTVTFRGQAATVHYAPLAVSLDLQRGMASLATPPHNPGPMVDELARVVTWWDVVRKGELVPITAEGIGSLPIELGLEIARAIMEDFRDPKSPLAIPPPAPPSPTRSPATSEPAAGSATAPSSPSPSSTPAGPASPSGTTSGSPTPPVT